MKQSEIANMSEASRARLIREIARVLRDHQVPLEAKQAGLTLIGWLARRMPEDAGEN